MLRVLPLVAWVCAACSGPSTVTVTDVAPPLDDTSTVVPPESTPVETDPLPSAQDEGAVPLEGPGLDVAPPAGTFVGTVTVTLASPDPAAVVRYTLDGTPPSTGEIYTGPIEVTDSTTVRAVARTPKGRTTAAAPSYLRLASDAETFSSDIPVMVLFSRDTAPTDKVEEYTTFSVSTFEPDVGSGRTVWPGDATVSSRAGLRVRGSSTAAFPKKPYRLETWRADVDLDLDVELLGMPPEADWVLQSPLDFDRGLIRNALMFELSNSIGAYAPRTRFAEVFVAEQGEAVGLDDYVGVYVVMERVERDADRVDLVRLDPTDVLEPELTGGYLFKEDRPGFGEIGFFAGTASGLLEFQQPFVFADPEEAAIVPEQSDYMIALLDELGVAVVQPDFTHPGTGNHYRDLIDVPSWIDNHILNVFAKNPDCFRLSAYYHKDREELLALGPIWDFDRSLGCDSDSRCDLPTWWDATNQTSDTTDVFDHGFWRGLFADPAFRDEYFARMDVLLQVQLSPAVVNAIMAGMEAELTEAAERNYAAWPSYPPRGGSLASEVALLEDWVATRHAWMTGCLALPDPTTCVGL